MKTHPRQPSTPRRLALLAAGVMLLAALADPAVTLPRKTYDFLFTLDITGSMNVEDAGPADARVRRLIFARSLVTETLAAMPCGSRAGLAIFTEHRTFVLFAPIEICDNHLVLSTMVDRIDGRMAWADLSEVAKGMYSGIDAVATLAGLAATDAEETAVRRPRLVFMTDGHEAPPVHPELRPRFRGEPGETGGLIAGIGGSVPVPIPWLDDEGNVAGYWAPEDVMQVDRHSLGRPSTQGGEAMAGADRSDLEARIAAGTEHLSSLREDYLRQLANETGLDYLRADNAEVFVRTLLDTRYADRRPAVTNVAWVPALLGLLCLLYAFGAPISAGRKFYRRTPQPFLQRP